MVIHGVCLMDNHYHIYLCRKYTGEKLKTIGNRFGIGESTVSHAYRRIEAKIEQNRNIKRKVEKIEKKLNVSNFKT